MKKIKHKKHQTIRIKNNIEVDKNIALLVSELNHLGLETNASCEGDSSSCDEENFAYISFKLKNAYFDYQIDEDILTIRWNRSKIRTSIPESTIMMDDRFLYIDDIKNIMMAIMKNPDSLIHYKNL